MMNGVGFGRSVVAYLFSLFILLSVAPTKAEATFGSCSNTSCNIHCSKQVTQSDSVPSGQRCTFTGSIANTSGIHLNPPYFYVTGNGCSLKLAYPGCDPANFSVTCEEGPVLFEADDSGELLYSKKCFPATYSISGKAKLSNGVGVPDVSVLINGGNAKSTNSNGNYIFSNLPNGQYTLTASKPGYVVSSTNFTNPVKVSGSNVINRNFILECAKNYQLVNNQCVRLPRISGKATLQGSATPIQGVSVTLSSGKSATTNSLGRYVLSNIPNGSYVLSGSKPGYILVSTSFTNPITVLNSNLTNQDFVFACAKGYLEVNGKCLAEYSIKGKATLEGSGTPIQGVTVKLSNGDTTTTNSIGTYALNQIVNGSYNLSGSIPGYKLISTSFTNPITVAGKNLYDQDFVFGCDTGYSNIKNQCIRAYKIGGEVVLIDTGRPVPGFRVTADGLGSTTTNRNGAYGFPTVPNGTYPLDATKPGYKIVSISFDNPAVVNGRNRLDLDFFVTCDEGFVVENNECVKEEEPKIIIDASDGTSPDHVHVTWNKAECAVSYQLYRTEFANEIPGAPLGKPLVAVEFFDTSAVPGVKYYYHVKALGQDGKECLASNDDPGHREKEDKIPDCDGDGVSDEQERLDGTDPCDPGSFQPHLKSPAYSKWNTFLSQLNFLELVANGTEPVEVTVTVFNIHGKVSATQIVPLLPGERFDVDVNALAREIDTYGLVKVSWDDSIEGATIAGRLTNYRPDPEGDTYSFAFSKELINAIKGKTYATGNSYDPQGMGYLVPNWTEIQNLDEENIQAFTYNLYNHGGELIETHQVRIPPLGERDINGGHENGEGVYLAEVIPHDGDAKYLMTVSRYSSNHDSGAEARTYNFAFARQGQKGTADAQYARISNEAGACYSQSNWVEVANTRNKTVVANVTFRKRNGEVIASTEAELKPFSQFHFNASALLGAETSGSVEVVGDAPGSLIMQSLVYYHDCESNLTQTAYLAPGRIGGKSNQIGTFNRFLSIENLLTLVNVVPDDTGVNLKVNADNTLLAEQDNTIGSQSTLELNLNDEGTFFTTPNSYGTVELTTSDSRLIVGEVLRIRKNPSNPGKMDFVIQTPVY